MGGFTSLCVEYRLVAPTLALSREHLLELTSISETFILTSLLHLGYRGFVTTRHAAQNQNRVLGQTSIIGVIMKV